MNLKDLWIGDKVMIKSSMRTGTYEGINPEGKARIKVEGKIFLVKDVNLEVIPVKEHYPDIHEFLKEHDLKPKETKSIKIKFDYTLDLHIEKLAPSMQNELTGRIIDFQLRSSELFIRDAIEKKMPHITIIHGKGEGILKTAIEQQLKQFHQVRFTFSKNGGGAVEVWL